MNPGDSDSHVPDNVLYKDMTPAQQGVVRMWLALKLPMQWKLWNDDSLNWDTEGEHADTLRLLQTEPQYAGNRCYYRLAPQAQSE